MSRKSGMASAREQKYQAGPSRIHHVEEPLASSNRDEDSKVCHLLSEMNLNKDIKQATVLKKAKTKPKFYLLKEPSQANKDRQMNERQVPTPKNLNILEDTCVDNTICDTTLPYNTVGNHNIAVSIREVNGGQDLSNQQMIEDWVKNISRNNIKEIHSPSLSEDISTCFNSPEVPNWTDNHRHDVSKHKFLKNAAFMGLVRCNIISVEDLICPSYGNISSGTNEEKEEENVYEFEYQVEAVPHEEDSEVFVHPLQKGLDEKQYSHVDFSLPRLAKKKRLTPQEYYVLTTDEKFFEFKKESNLEKKSSKKNSI
ncbi:uncharacterized protein LOC109852897 isoform X2 [Pseudomyrmex gracilis]|nr:uncharacterized protein LOC109852897 isoform X2 [Pseudomyrmex gracilis]XP_020280051.1 uncharacterized protein LOC109852897 isoform X2 [Pseudomyrmex gracilis]XP_020280052.1 uncharacterized protein LOC109852897 isoform X2 [Pseudomyrmex gracilis]